MTLLWSPSQPMVDAVPSAPVKASVATLNGQRYAGSGPGTEGEVADAAGPAPGRMSVLEMERTAATKRQCGRWRAQSTSRPYGRLPLYQTTSWSHRLQGRKTTLMAWDVFRSMAVPMASR